MYTAASPGNLLPKFSEPKMPPGPAGTIAHRASVLQKATGVVAAGYLAAGAHCVWRRCADTGPGADERDRPQENDEKGQSRFHCVSSADGIASMTRSGSSPAR